jgi:anti-sigma factor RsiW
MTTPESELDSLLGAYALDAVDELERVRVERYIASSPRARAEVDEHLQVAMMLGNSAGPAPLALWDRIDQKIQLGAAAPKEAPSPSPFTTAPLSGPKRAGGSRISTATLPGTTTGGAVVRRPSFGLSAAAAACVAAILAISTVTFSQTRRINELQATVARTNIEAGTQSGN